MVPPVLDTPATARWPLVAEPRRLLAFLAAVVLLRVGEAHAQRTGSLQLF